MLDVILRSDLPAPRDPALLVGNESLDDAAVYDLGNGTAIISTTDFFMPVVDDPFTFGRIAATNAINDVYAMGGRPILAVAIFAWPIAKLDAEVGRIVVEGGRRAALDAGITIAGGHSIDAPEPIFGLAVNGIVRLEHLKRNCTARVGDRLYLTKPLGVGILTTAEKRKLLRPEHKHIAPAVMCQLNAIGASYAELPGVSAMTDVTGFGLLGHLVEICEASGVGAELAFDAVPVLPHLDVYLAAGSMPGGTDRNRQSFQGRIGPVTVAQSQILFDPQTSGGLLICVTAAGEREFLDLSSRHGLELAPIGRIVAQRDGRPVVTIR